MPEVIRTKVVGVTKRNGDGQRRQELIELLSPGDELYLEREPDNEYDQNAIAVYNDTGEQIGYIKSELAQELAPKMDNGDEVTCKVTEITGGEDDKPTYGCNIEITIYSPEEWIAQQEEKKKAIQEVASTTDEAQQSKTPQQKWMERAEKLEKIGQSMQDTGKKTQRIGCALTLLFTFPIVGLFFGPIGFIIGAGLGLLLFIGMFSQRKKQ